MAGCEIGPEQVFVELWVSLTSLLRSYTAAHGWNGNHQATVEWGDKLIAARHGEKSLVLEREGAQAVWRRQDGVGGSFQLRADGRLEFPDEGPVEMDMKAEEWARELMR